MLPRFVKDMPAMKSSSMRLSVGMEIAKGEKSASEWAGGGEESGEKGLWNRDLGVVSSVGECRRCGPCCWWAEAGVPEPRKACGCIGAI